MTASTDILPFAEAVGANVLTQAQYAALASLLADGFTTGILPSNQLNKVLRQSSFMAAGLANWMVARGISVPDDGNLANLVAEISQALAVFLTDNVGITYAGNPNGFVAGSAGIPGTQFPSMVWDTAHNMLWICTTTGTATTAVWTSASASGGTPPYWCGLSAGTANAQTLTTPVSLISFATGTAVAWEVGAGLTNTGATTLTVGTFGTFQLRKDGPTGPIALTGGELVAGNIVSGRFDGTYIQLTATEMGTAALANASSNTGTVAAVSGSVAAGHLAVFNNTTGTIADGGPPGGAAASMYINSSTTVGPGPYLTDTSVTAFTATLPATPVLGTSCEFIDGPGTWGTNNLTIGHNGNTIMGSASDLICNVSGEDFRIWYNGSDWILE